MSPRSRARSSAALRGLYLEYGLNAVGVVPHMVFLVDFIARGLGQGLTVGARYWVIFGLGAVGGPMLAGLAADRIGFRATLRLAFLLQAGAVALVVLTDRPLALLVSSAVVGAFVPGVVPLTLGRVHELVPDEQDARPHGAVARPPSRWGKRARPMPFPMCSHGPAAGMRCFSRPARARCCSRSSSSWCGRVRGPHDTEVTR